jgi:hypothetical protein
MISNPSSACVKNSMCLFPAWFGVLAYGYAALCALTVFQRSAMAVAAFRD